MIMMPYGCPGHRRSSQDRQTFGTPQAARNRSATVISAHLADKIINVVTVIALDGYAAAAVARAIVSDALKCQSCHCLRRTPGRSACSCTEVRAPLPMLTS
jgi:hypothetical protein